MIEFEHNGSQIRLLKVRNPWGQGEWTGDWSDKSPLWTDELRQQLNLQNVNDGCFYIPFKDYLRQFLATDVCSPCDFNNYQHSSAFLNFSTDQSDQPMTFFRFRLDRQIDFRNEAFAISVSQQGDRLGRYRLKNKKFEPSRFNILLGKTDGQLAKANVGDEFL